MTANNFQCQNKYDESIKDPILFQERALLHIHQIQKQSIMLFLAIHAFPPQHLIMVLKAVFLIISGQSNSKKYDPAYIWKYTRGYICKNFDAFLGELSKIFQVSYDCQKMGKIIKMVKQNYLCEQWFNVKSIHKISQAGGQLCGWVINVVNYWESLAQKED